MSLEEYFGNIQGKGILSTANKDGKVNAAIFARPHVIDDNTIAFIMGNKRSYGNIQENGQATYMFIEDGNGYKGKRLYLTKTKEETNKEIIDAMRMKRSTEIYERYKDMDSTLVYFQIDETRPLVGG